VLIAHALISQPRLLLLDEPLANLDIRSGQEIISLLHRVAKDQNVAVFLSAHEINPLLRSWTESSISLPAVREWHSGRGRESRCPREAL